MSTIADAKVAHYYNCYNGYFFGCLQIDVQMKKYVPSPVDTKCIELPADLKELIEEMVKMSMKYGRRIV